MIWSLIVFIGLNFAAALSGAFFSPGAWYEKLEKPSWQPPNWAFPVVWTVLYILNAVAGWIVWEAVGVAGAGFFALVVYVVSLVLNAGWSALFFGMRRMQLALWEALALWLSVALQIILFYQIVPAAGLILLPYLVWVSIAVWLNRTMLKLNPTYA